MRRSCYCNEVWRSSFSKRKAVLKNVATREMSREENSPFEKTSQMKLVLAFSLRFSPRGSFILISIHGEMGSIHMNTCFAKSDINSIGPFQSPSQDLKAFLLAA